MGKHRYTIEQDYLGAGGVADTMTPYCIVAYGVPRAERIRFFSSACVGRPANSGRTTDPRRVPSGRIAQHRS